MKLSKARAILADENNPQDSGIRPHRRVFEGLRTLDKYDADLTVSADDDQIFVGSFSESVNMMSEDDFKFMIGMGWFEDEETDSWSKFTSKYDNHD